MDKERMEKLVSLAKRRGFIYQGSEIYGGLAGTWDYGPAGTALKNNIKSLWWKMFVDDRNDMYGVDAAILMNQKVWQASGHVDGFTDPLVECKKCRRRFRSDHLDGEKCPDCGGALGEEKKFNMMFETTVGPIKDSSAVSYLRPETAQGIFTNYKNILDTHHPNLPFGIAQIGKAFRNEIAPRDFIFRAREFEQMEIEWFIREKEWKKHFEYWTDALNKWVETIGLNMKKISVREIPANELAHYSKRTVDFEYEYPFGVEELYGLAYRTDHDLKQHRDHSNVDLRYYDQENDAKFFPHVVEPSLGVDRTVLAVLDSAYCEEEAPTADGKVETRVVMKLKSELAPVKIAVLPLMRKEQLMNKAREIFSDIKSLWITLYDETGSIGKRYRRQDEVGTPYCITIDFDTLTDDSVTIRNRDSMKQDRVPIADLQDFFAKHLT